MTTANLTASAPYFYFNGHRIDSSYSFSEYSKPSGNAKTHKVWLDMIFMDPVKEEAVTLRVAKHALILCQPKEVIEVIAQRDIMDFLTFSRPSRSADRRKNKVGVVRRSTVQAA